MDKKRIEEYRHIEAAVKNLKKEIAQLKRRAEEATGEEMPDIAKGSSPDFPYNQIKVKITGIDHTKQDRLIKMLAGREAEYEQKLIELEEWLEGVTDPLMYNILSLKVRNGMTDEEIGANVGYSRSRICQMIKKYLSESED